MELHDRRDVLRPFELTINLLAGGKTDRRGGSRKAIRPIDFDPIVLNTWTGYQRRCGSKLMRKWTLSLRSGAGWPIHDPGPYPGRTYQLALSVC